MYNSVSPMASRHGFYSKKKNFNFYYIMCIKYVGIIDILATVWTIHEKPCSTFSKNI